MLWAAGDGVVIKTLVKVDLTVDREEHLCGTVYTVSLLIICRERERERDYEYARQHHSLPYHQHIMVDPYHHSSTLPGIRMVCAQPLLIIGWERNIW